MIKEAENIILSKDYSELTADELETVSDFVQSAEEYEDMKWFLASTQKTLVHDKIEATPQLKKRVMDYLHKEEPQRKFWLNSVGAFLWPEDKEFYRKPAFQMGIAAILLIGILLVFKQPIDQQQMAVNDTVYEEETVPTAPEELSAEEDFESAIEENKEEVVTTGESAEGKDEAVDETVALDMDLAESEYQPSEDVIDLTHDGWYTGPADPDEEAEEMPVMTDPNSVVQSKSNATNNERNDSRNEITSFDEEQKEIAPSGLTKGNEHEKNKNLNRTIALQEKDRRDKSNDENKAKKEVRKKLKASFAYKPEVSQNQSGSGNLGGAEISNSVSLSQPVTEELTLAGDMDEMEESQDILPTQFSVKSTPELNSLFTTFK